MCVTVLHYSHSHEQKLDNIIFIKCDICESIFNVQSDCNPIAPKLLLVTSVQINK